MKKIISELGDVEWYLTGIRTKLKVAFDYTLQENRRKLKERG